MIAAAKATFYQDWETKMEEIKKVNQETYEWLVVIPRCKHVLGCANEQLVRIIEWYYILLTDKLIITMMEWIRCYMIVDLDI